MSDSKTLGGDTVQPSKTLFYAYVHDVSSSHYRFVLTFSSSDMATKWWEAVQKLSDQRAQSWSRPGAQLFAFQNSGDNGPMSLWAHQELLEFKPHCMFSQIPSGGSGKPFTFIPIQWEDGYEVGSKYVHTIQAHMPGQGGDKGKEEEEKALEQAKNAQKRRDELRKEGKPVRW